MYVKIVAPECPKPLAWFRNDIKNARSILKRFQQDGHPNASIVRSSKEEFYSVSSGCDSPAT